MFVQFNTPILVCRFLSGREFTVAVTDGIAHVPIERLFAEDEVRRELVPHTSACPTHILSNVHFVLEIFSA
jgi:hypothetical protein